MSVPGDIQSSASQSSAPRRAGLVLVTLILAAGIANINLAVANVALPDIGKAFTASQTALDMVAIGYSVGLAASVLYLGAIGDRYGRKLLLALGMALSVPACLLAAFAPSAGVLIAARLLGGVSAGMAYPTTLALITALWSGPARTRAIALWSGVGSAIAVLGPLVSGILLEHYWWGSVFLFTLPFAVLALVMVVWCVPAHVNESAARLDNLGGILSVVLVTALIVGINLAPVPGKGTLTLGAAAVAVAAAIAFVLRQRRAANPLYDLHIAGRRVFWVAAVGGIIVFGALMAALFVGQQFMQNVLGYSTIDAGIAGLPAAVVMVLVAAPSARLVHAYGSRFSLLAGYLFVLLSFVVMLLLWTESSPYWQVGLGYALIGAGVGLFGTPASHSLTAAVPVNRVGMASGTADLQRDLGGAIMQSIFGALLTAGYAAAVAKAIAAAPDKAQITSSVQNQLEKSFSSAAAVAKQYPQHASAITAGAKTSFLQGADWAYAVGIIATVIGIALVLFLFPGKDKEREQLAAYQMADSGQAPTVNSPLTTIQRCWIALAHFPHRAGFANGHGCAGYSLASGP
jgi:DHA2 family multidrug resistance protein-like MFS transporter